MTVPTEELKKKIEHLKSEVSEPRRKSLGSVAVLITVMSDMIGGVLVGTSIGFVCSRFLGWGKISFAVFLILGGIAGILNIYRFFKAENIKDA